MGPSDALPLPAAADVGLTGLHSWAVAPGVFSAVRLVLGHRPLREAPCLLGAIEAPTTQPPSPRQRGGGSRSEWPVSLCVSLCLAVTARPHFPAPGQRRLPLLSDQRPSGEWAPERQGAWARAAPVRVGSRPAARSLTRLQATFARVTRSGVFPLQCSQ